MTPRLYKCIRCGYHYEPKRMARYVHVGGRTPDAPDRYICRNAVRCSKNIARREADREALKR